MTEDTGPKSTGADLRPRERPEALEFLLTRRSTPAKTLVSPGPDDDTLQRILTAGLRTPDHGKLEPWRLIVIRPAAQARLADAAVARAQALGETEEVMAKTRKSLLDGAMIVAVIASPQPSEKIPEVEQLLSAGAVCLSILNAALASGVGANWLSGWISHDRAFCEEHLGLASTERVAGLIHLGTPKTAPPERPRPDLSAKISELKT
ncbi:MAG: nitroreductase [Pseudomonadota bacterium]